MGSIEFKQNSQFSPVLVKMNVREQITQIHIHKFPEPVRKNLTRNVCEETGEIFNLNARLELKKPLLSGLGTSDQYKTGALSEKLELLKNHENITMVDPFLTLFGENNILGRSVVARDREGS